MPVLPPKLERSVARGAPERAARDGGDGGDGEAASVADDDRNGEAPTTDDDGDGDREAPGAGSSAFRGGAGLAEAAAWPAGTPPICGGAAAWRAASARALASGGGWSAGCRARSGEP